MSRVLAQGQLNELVQVGIEGIDRPLALIPIALVWTFVVVIRQPDIKVALEGVH